MRYVMIFRLVILTFFFHCGDAKAEAPDNIYFVTLDEVKAKMAAKENLYLLTGRLDNIDTQNALEKLSQVNQVINFLDTKEIDYVAYKKLAKKYNIRTITHLAHFKGKYQFAVANVLTADLAGFFAV